MTPAEAARAKLNTALDKEAPALRRAGDAAEVFGVTSLARATVWGFERARACSNEADRELRVILGRYSGRRRVYLATGSWAGSRRRNALVLKSGQLPVTGATGGV